MIESLEPRIAPASVTITYTDHDGDLVKIKASNRGPAAPPLDLADLAFLGGGDSGQLATLDLTDPAFAGASITFTVVRKPGGDGLAHVGRIDATGVNLGKVIVKGDLAVIDAGDSAGTALQSLLARSMGLFGTATQGGGDLQSNFAGNVGAITVLTDLRDADLRLSADLGRFIVGGDLIGGAVDRSGTLNVTGSVEALIVRGNVIGGSQGNAGSIDVLGSIGSVTVGGSVIGNAAFFFGGPSPAIFHEGQIFAGLTMGPVKIGGDLLSGTGAAGGQVRAGGDIVSITVRGSIIGDVSAGTGGHICAEGDLGPVKIGGSVIGGLGFFTGAIESFGATASITIGGSLIGGKGSFTGAIVSRGALGPVQVRGDVTGGSISGSEPGSDVSGTIYGLGIARVAIGGSLIAGIDTSTSGNLIRNGAIISGQDIGSIAVKGSLVGHATPNGLTRVLIAAAGQATPSATSDLALGKLTIGKRVELAQILAGHDAFNQGAPAAVNGNASIGVVSVGGDWFASNLVAGIRDTNGDGFGNADDTLIAAPSGADTDAILARIASVAIKGVILGTAQSSADHFGFTAQQIGSFTVNGAKLSLTPATDPAIPLALLTNDVSLREV